MEIAAALTAADATSRALVSLRNELIPSPEILAMREADALRWERDQWKYTCYGIIGMLVLLIIIGRRS